MKLDRRDFASELLSHVLRATSSYSALYISRFTDYVACAFHFVFYIWVHPM